MILTDKEPYEITVNYKNNKDLCIQDYNKFWSERNPNETLEENALVLLALVKMLIL